MRGDELLDVLEHLDADLIVKADAPVRKKRPPRWSAAVAAVLVLVIGIAFMLDQFPNGPVQIGNWSGTSHSDHPTNCSCRPEPSTGPSVPYSSGPSHASPSNFCFERLSQLKQMLAISKERPDDLLAFVHSENIGYWGGYYPTSSDVALLEDWLEITAVPCRNDHEDTLFGIYYHPKLFYDKDRLEFFYNVNGIRYCFMVCDSPTWTPDGEDVTTVQLGGVSAEMREGSYGSSRRLMAHFYVNDVVISMWADTTDPSEVDLSGFFLSTILTVE